MVSPTPPRGNLSAIGAPSSTNTKHATASANFLWISTPYEFISVELSCSLRLRFSRIGMSVLFGGGACGWTTCCVLLGVPDAVWPVAPFFDESFVGSANPCHAGPAGRCIVFGVDDPACGMRARAGGGGGTP